MIPQERIKRLSDKQLAVLSRALAPPPSPAELAAVVQAEVNARAARAVAEADGEQYALEIYGDARPLLILLLKFRASAFSRQFEQPSPTPAQTCPDVAANAPALPDLPLPAPEALSASPTAAAGRPKAANVVPLRRFCAAFHNGRELGRGVIRHGLNDW
jgi:hypothetical protein